MGLPFGAYDQLRVSPIYGWRRVGGSEDFDNIKYAQGWNGYRGGFVFSECYDFGNNGTVYI